jgi:penicillin-binding protein 1A
VNFELRNKGHWLVVLPKLVLVMALWAGAWGGVAALDWYGSLVPLHEAPERITFESDTVPSVVLSARGLQIGGLERGGSEWVRFDQMSADFVRAVLASEDTRFFYHTGFDFEGIARAARVNLAAGRSAQGGSTLTQQLAKTFVGDEPTYERKLTELIVARRIEVAFSKSEIFESWANRAYFGAGADGVGAAARIYFGVTPADLTLAQSAMLAALIPMPGRTNPFNHQDEALTRRNRSLDRLLESGMATAAEVDQSRALPLGLRRGRELRVRAPGIERAVWAELQGINSDIDWRRGARVIETEVDLVRQLRAGDAMRTHLHLLDSRQGLRSHLGFAQDSEEFHRAWEETEFNGESVPALVTSVSNDSVSIWAGEALELPAENWQWATRYQSDGQGHNAILEDATEAFSVGDVLLLHESLGIVQFPRVEAAYASADLSNGMFEALVGGFDPNRTDFNRATQGCRQPGSTFKPIVYSAALDHGFTPATLLRDAPVRIRLGPFEEWRPRNSDGGFEGHITLWQALVWSRNLPALKVYGELGPALTIERGQSLGITTPMDGVASLALGASCVRPTDLLTVYSSFARGGFGLEPRLVSRALTSDSRETVDYGGAAVIGIGAEARLGALWRERNAVAAPRVHRRNAFQVAWLLREVVANGTASDLRDLPYEVAGKTGTTNAYDAWFAGFSSRDVSVAWIGSDENTRPLGRRETGGHVALPAWGAAQMEPMDSLSVLPPAPHTIEWVDIEPESGRRAVHDRWSVPMPFLTGTGPVGEAETRERLDAMQIDRIGREF